MTLPWTIFMVAFEALCLMLAAVCARLAFKSRGRFERMLASAREDDYIRWARGPDGTVWVDLGKMIDVEGEAFEEAVPVRRLRWLYGRALAPQADPSLWEMLR